MVPRLAHRHGQRPIRIQKVLATRANHTRVCRIFALKTASPFELEGELIESIPSSFRLNRIMGGRDVVKLAAIVGVDKVMKRREFHAPDAQTS